MSEAELWIADQNAPLRPLLRAARRLARRSAPRAAERVFPVCNALGFRSDHLFCVVYPYRGGVKIAFERGSEMEDPESLMQQTGKRMKFVMILKRDDLSDAMGRLVRSAASQSAANR